MTRITVAKTLSPEVVQQIFAPLSATLFTNKLSRFPWFLGHICSTWRSIFLSMTNEFWSTIDIELYDLEQRFVVESVVRFFLDRDPAAPISFSLRVPNPDSVTPGFGTQNTDYIRLILEILVETSMRWKDVFLSIEGSSSEAHLSPLHRAKDRLPLLQKVHAMLWGKLMVPNPMNDIFQTAMSVNAIHITNLTDWKFNWSNIKTIDVGLLGRDPFDFIPVLSQMTSLERLKINDKFSRDIIQYDDPTVLPSLTTLNCGPGWLPFLKVPALQDLTIQYKYGPPSSNLVLPFLRRSSCNVLCLCIDRGDAATALEIVGLTPQIARLVLSDVNDLRSVLEHLIVSTNSTRESLAPHLSSLYIRFASGKEDISPLPRLIPSRATSGTVDNPGCKRLQTLGLYMCNLSSATIRQLIALCKEHEICYTDDPSF